MLIENLDRYCERPCIKQQIHPRQDNYDEIVMCDPCKAFIRGEHFLNNKKVIQKGHNCQSCESNKKLSALVTKARGKSHRKCGNLITFMHPRRKQKNCLHEHKSKQPKAAGRSCKKEVNQQHACQNTGDHGNCLGGYAADQLCIDALVIQAKRAI